MKTRTNLFSSCAASLLLHGLILIAITTLCLGSSSAFIPAFKRGDSSFEVTFLAPPSDNHLPVSYLPPALEQTPAVEEPAPEPELPPAGKPIKEDYLPEDILIEEENAEPFEEPVNQVAGPVKDPSASPSRETEIASATTSADKISRRDSSDSSGTPLSGVTGNFIATSQIHPNYPLGARLRGEEGIVTIQALISISGYPQSPSILKSSGYPALDRAALNAMQKARFVPIHKTAKPIESQMTLTFRFQIED